MVCCAQVIDRVTATKSSINIVSGMFYHHSGRNQRRSNLFIEAYSSSSSPCVSDRVAEVVRTIEGMWNISS